VEKKEPSTVNGGRGQGELTYQRERGEKLRGLIYKKELQRNLPKGVGPAFKINRLDEENALRGLKIGVHNGLQISSEENQKVTSMSPISDKGKKAGEVGITIVEHFKITGGGIVIIHPDRDSWAKAPNAWPLPWVGRYAHR